ncbi:hypothetical protein BDA99DRAFT_254432 [Phascolomyces articulosus]|uniref:F-box domain-containing protein n=1 Tax=Phascolomyces articulosus TaxID=60185 RepID=A0AAD5JNI9_9FUNG|nr:hypothetical protein BDA99DRAFT_254432 [Phascolomyces articulosus]
MAMTTISSSHLHVDFLMALPLDIVPLIVQYLETPERLNLLSVSKAWKTRLFGYASLWSNMALTFTNIKESNMNDEISIRIILKGLELIACHVRQLSVTDFLDNEIPFLITTLLNQLKNGLFVKLEKLEMFGNKKKIMMETGIVSRIVALMDC